MKTRFPLTSLVRLAPVLLLVVGLGLLSSCATSPAERAYVAGQLSRDLAVTTYQAIYRGWRHGVVSDQDLAEAQNLYDQWAKTQTRYLEASRTGTVDLLTGASLQASLQALLALAHRVEVL